MGGEENRNFDRLVESYYQAWFRFHPEIAVDIGVSGYETSLAPYDDDEIGALESLNEKLLAALDELDQSRLDKTRQIDFQLLRGGALIEHRELLEQDWRRRDPARYLPLNAIYQLTVRPVGNFAEALRARLEAIPAYLRGARSHLSSLTALIPRPWLESAITEAASGADFMRGLVFHPKVKKHVPDLENLRALLEQGARALEEYQKFLSDLKPEANGSFACGREHFDRLLGCRHFLEIDADQLHDFGRQLFDRTAGELKAAAQELGSEDVEALTQSLKDNHPPTEDLLDEYRRQMVAAREFLEGRDLVSLPKTEQLKVVETPMFLRHQIPFAAYLEPALNDPDQVGHYYVTPAENAETLGEHHYAGIGHTCVHEAWPGHHLQFVTANLNPVASTLPRLINPSATLYEGWALYSEQLMVEEGFLAKPEQRFILLRDRLWRALRIMIDVEIHTRGLTLEEAADRMQSALGFPRSQAMADLTWYCRAPTIPMGYATGWALIRAARNYLQTQSEFDLKEFHNGLLGDGSIALPLVLRNSLGDDVWSALSGLVFSSD